jgi:hypothetical protein
MGAVQGLFLKTVIQMALLESCAIFGLLRAFVSYNPQKMLPFLAISLTGAILAFPKEPKRSLSG